MVSVVEVRAWWWLVAATVESATVVEGEGGNRSGSERRPTVPLLASCCLVLLCWLPVSSECGRRDSECGGREVKDHGCWAWCVGVGVGVGVEGTTGAVGVCVLYGQRYLSYYYCAVLDGAARMDGCRRVLWLLVLYRTHKLYCTVRVRE